MKLPEDVGATGRIWQIFIADSSSTTGAGLTNLAYNTSGLVCYAHRNTDTTPTQVTLVSMTLGSYTSGGFIKIDDSLMPGWYQFCPPNALLASGADSVAVNFRGATNMAPLPIEVTLSQNIINAIFNPSGTIAAKLGILWAGTLASITDTSITLPGGHGLSHEGNYAVVLTGGTNAFGKAHYLTYSGSGETWTVDPAWNSDSETTPSGTITAILIPSPKQPTATLPVVTLAATGMDAVDDQANAVETGLSRRAYRRLAAAVLFGKVSGQGGTTPIFRNAVADTKPRVTATVDTVGNRTAITVDAT